MNNFEILYDSRLDYQQSKYPYRIIRYCFNNTYREIRFYKKQKEFYFDDIKLEKYIVSTNNHSYNNISDIFIKCIGDEKIVNYTFNKQIFELHYDKDDEEFYFDKNELKKYIMNRVL